MKPIKPLRGEFYLGLFLVMWGVARFTHWFALIEQGEAHITRVIVCAVYSFGIGAGISILAGEVRGEQ